MGPERKKATERRAKVALVPRYSPESNSKSSNLTALGTGKQFSYSMKTLPQEDIEKILKGNLEPLTRIFLANFQKLQQNLEHFNNASKEDAEDVLKDAILVLHDKIIQREFLNHNIPSFLLTVAKNKLRNKQKRDRKQLSFAPSKVEAYLLNKGNEDNSHDLSEEQQRKIDVAFLALKKMGYPCNQLLRRSIYEGIPSEEIRKEMGYKNVDVVKSSKARCLSKLIALVKDMMKKVL